jgi:two-component system sensor histidine kinase PilS (NtrC family)
MHFAVHSICATGNKAINTTANTATSPDQHNRSWHYLRLFNYYRGALSCFFLVLYLNGWTELFIRPEDYDPILFFLTSVAYTLSFILFTVTIYLHKPGLDLQVILQTCVDTVAIILLMHASGGVLSGIGMLLIINVSMTSLFLPRRTTLFLAATTSLALLGEHIYSQLMLPHYREAYVQTGLLGILIFSFAYTTSIYARRLRESEQIISERSRELKSAVQMNEHIIRNMRTGILVVDTDGYIQMANNAAESLLGHRHIPHHTSLKQAFPDLHARYTDWKANTAAVPVKPVQQSHGLPDIQPGFSRINPEEGNNSSTLIFIEDATQLNQRFQQVRLASLGRLTASIAHEIRNPLAAIQHASQLLDEAVQQGPDKKLTGIINTQAQRLNGVVENVLQLSRQQRGTPEAIELLPWLKTFREEYTSSQGLDLRQVPIQIHPADTRVLFDSSQLHQVMWNLCGNAVNHSNMDKRNIMISIKGGESNESDQPFIDIIDNGPGIDTETAQQIFDPFFTTSNEGTGLGLYITKEVTESNRAKIRHIALPAGGTCFRIYFLQAPQPGGNPVAMLNSELSH